MRKQEFLAQLRKALSGLPQDEIEERLTFYGEMIDDRMEEGLSEEERELEEPVILEYIIDGDCDYLEEIVDEDEYDEIYGLYFGEGYEA